MNDKIPEGLGRQVSNDAGVRDKTSVQGDDAVEHKAPESLADEIGRSYAECIRDIIDSNLCVAARFKNDGTCIFASTRCEDIFGISAEAILGKTLSALLGHKEPESCSRHQALMTALGEGIRTEGTFTVNCQGLHKTYLIMVSPEKFERQISRYADVMFVDISNCLDIFHAQRHSSINRERFIGIVAHELRNPLSAIASGLKIIAVSPSGAETQQIREMMERQVSHLSRLVHDLLDMSRINEAKLTLLKSKVLLSEIISLAVETAQDSIKKGEHQLRVCLPEEPIEIYADSSRIAQVISNLLDNGSKYSPARGVITLQVRQEQDELSIAVKDNGMGIAPEHRDGIFRQFMQIDGASRRSRGGLGLGLYLVKMIVEAHGGTITARSDGVGKGSEFEVRLPLL
jgi:signal transduction histidine kinase